jgi:L-ascorbate metabolism protein UlaG (beta-lactamase superfamily)
MSTAATSILVLVALAAGGPATVAAPSLSARFIGNAAFEISDGTVTLLTDFPYRSGAFGYMRYAAAELTRRDAALCLFTHGHADHFEASLLPAVGCRVAGPSAVLAATPAAARMPGTAPWTWGPLSVTPHPTPHADGGHFSYLVTWAGRRLYFAGDTEAVDLAGPAGTADVLFLTPWQLGAALASPALPPRARIVVHHHGPEEAAPACAPCRVPRQGEVIALEAAEARLP